jgi:hypothetical protein
MRSLVVFASLLFAACDVGELPGTGTDGGNTTVDGADNTVCVDTVTPAAAAHQHGGGGTNAGLGCQNAGCHGTVDPAGPTWSFSGTVYTDATAAAPKPGATIKVTFGSTTVTAVSDDAGNFYSSQTIMFPARTLGTACPTVANMVSGLSTGGGNCNSCHALTGGTTSPIFVQ